MVTGKFRPLDNSDFPPPPPQLHVQTTLNYARIFLFITSIQNRSSKDSMSHINNN